MGGVGRGSSIRASLALIALLVLTASSPLLLFSVANGFASAGAPRFPTGGLSSVGSGWDGIVRVFSLNMEFPGGGRALVSGYAVCGGSGYSYSVVVGDGVFRAEVYLPAVCTRLPLASPRGSEYYVVAVLVPLNGSRVNSPVNAGGGLHGWVAGYLSGARCPFELESRLEGLGDYLGRGSVSPASSGGAYDVYWVVVLEGSSCWSFDITR